MNSKTSEQQTIGTLAVARKCRKGQAFKITSDGAYWLACDVRINRGGGDGIGQDSADITEHFRVRHYRDGSLRAYCAREAWHQNDGTAWVSVRCDQVLAARTIEDLLVILRGLSYFQSWGDCPVTVDSRGEGNLSDAFPELPVSESAPDDEPAAAVA